jgi:hypothetical protein
MTDIPAAEVIAEHARGGIRTTRILCPWCGRTHQHIRPTDGGTYAAPCGYGEYSITQKTGTVALPVALQRRAAERSLHRLRQPHHRNRRRDWP